MLAAGVMLSLAMGLLTGCGGEKKEAAKKDKVTVGIVQIVEHAALDVASKGFVDGLAEKGFKEGQNIAFDRQNAQADQSNLRTIAERFINNNCTYVDSIQVTYFIARGGYSHSLQATRQYRFCAYGD